MRPNAGVSLVEAMVALMILAIVSAAVIMMTLQVLALNTSAKLKNQSTTYAEQMIEQVRDYYANSGWGGLAAVARPGGQCYLNVPSWQAAVNNPCTPCVDGAITGTNFYRFVTLTSSSNSVMVAAKVCWLERGQTKTTEVDTYFYNF
ncbi:prepilin-type N-terminal cleavage/methylation domain-containing protein [Candidatus Microgenomates bacterium]|nr:prepilin-type N-terminal cleavage/methylation domain-containing protein [Candidatus Microgenomates bacterium]